MNRKTFMTFPNYKLNCRCAYDRGCMYLTKPHLVLTSSRARITPPYPAKLSYETRGTPI